MGAIVAVKIRAMIMPMPIPNVSERTSRAMAKSTPMTPPVYTSARMFAAGAKKRKVMAGPSPAPFLWDAGEQRHDRA